MFSSLSLKAIKGLLPLALLPVVACQAPPEEAVIGFPFADWGYRNVRVAEEEMAPWLERSNRTIRITFDSTVSGDPTGRELERAAELVAIPELAGVVGHGGSRGSLVGASLYNQEGVPQIVPTGTSRRLTTAGPWTFTLAPNDSVEGVFIADFIMEELNAESVTIFYENDEYGEGLRDGVVSALSGSGQAIVDQVPYTTESDLPDLVLLSLESGTPQVVVVAGRESQAGEILHAFDSLRPGLTFVGGDGIELTTVLSDPAGSAMDSLFVVSFWDPASPNPRSRDFVERYRRVTGEEPQASHAMRHDALMLMTTAILETGGEREDIREYLLSLGVSSPPYQGVTGPIAFTRDRPPRLIMVRGRDGRVVWPDRGGTEP